MLLCDGQVVYSKVLLKNESIGADTRNESNNTDTMSMRRIAIFFLSLLICNLLFGQTQFKVVVKETDTWRDIYCFVDKSGNLIRQLDTSKYYVSFNNDKFGYFAIVGMKGFSGWAAIDANEKVLFNVYNTSFGEPNPDYLIEGKIRIIDKNNLIGFANHKGQVIIKPQFEAASSFHKGKAIIGQRCKEVPWNKHAKEGDCHHYSTICERHGYINNSGVIVKMGKYSFDQIMKQIGWKAPEE
jgi:hypothetical protein